MSIMNKLKIYTQLKIHRLKIVKLFQININKLSIPIKIRNNEANTNLRKLQQKKRNQVTRNSRKNESVKYKH